MERNLQNLTELLLIQKLSYEEVGRLFNVTGAAIKKQCLKLGMKLEPRKINKTGWIPHNKNTTQINYCQYCNSILIKNQKKYCSLKCSSLNVKKKSFDSIFRNNCAPSSVLAKRYLIEKTGYFCSICFINTWRNLPVPLVLDHIDGHSENNSLDNLRLVCGNCDMQLSTYKGKNMGKGRFSRRQRYLEGKSY